MQEKIIAAMGRPDFYPHRPEKVDLIKTHISLVFLAGDLVYKVKKPLSFGFLDFTTLAARKHYCTEEVRLNRRLAADFYLAVAPIHEDAQGRLTLAPEGRIVEYAVLMRKLPQERMLKTLLAQGLAQEELFEALGMKIAAFHARAATSPQISRMGMPETIARSHQENFAEMAPYVDVTIPDEQYTFIRDYDRWFLSRRAELLTRRMAGGRIRECHGDLHLEHICMTPDIAVFDCIEFNERFRCVDTAAEVAFLSMDMDLNGYHGQGERFIRSYLRHSGDEEIVSLLDFYRCYYAFVRGKVASLRLAQQEEAVAKRLDILEESEKYFALAYGYAARPERPVLLLTAGLTGTGKSYLAEKLAFVFNAEVIRTDEVRKQLLRMDPTDRRLDGFGQGIYSEEITGRTYETAFNRAATLIGDGRTVILDASFKRRADRDRAVALANRLGVDHYVIECICPEAMARERLARRMDGGTDASDGRWEIYQRQREDFDALVEIQAGRHLCLDGALDFKTQFSDLVRRISLASRTA
jgi:aminoglycoside phosphotransferase family enzyme/predicted kinase